MVLKFMIFQIFIFKWVTQQLIISFFTVLKYCLMNRQPICQKMVDLHCPLNNAICLRFLVRTIMSLRTTMSLSVIVWYLITTAVKQTKNMRELNLHLLFDKQLL